MVVTPDTEWFSDPRPYFFFESISDQQMHICIPSHMKSEDSGLINPFQYFFIYIFRIMALVGMAVVL